MNARLNEAELRMMVDGLKAENTDITNENVIKRIRGGLESQGFHWNEDLERKIKYCIHINPNRAQSHA